MATTAAKRGITAAGAAGAAALAVAAWAASAGGGSGVAHADTTTTTTTTNSVTVDGTGSVAGTPDTMVATFSTVTKAADPSGALSSASKAMGLVLASLRSHGLASADLKTTGISVSPYYNYAKGQPRREGYQAEEDLQVTFHNLKSAGATLSAVAKAGGKSVTVGGLSLTLNGDDALVTAARSAAFANAKAKAQQYATLSGRTLGPVVSVSEHVDQSGGNGVVYGYAAASAAAAPVPASIQAGSQNVGVNVTVVWSLG